MIEEEKLTKSRNRSGYCILEYLGNEFPKGRVIADDEICKCCGGAVEKGFKYCTPCQECCIAEQPEEFKEFSR